MGVYNDRYSKPVQQPAYDPYANSENLLPDSLIESSNPISIVDSTGAEVDAYQDITIELTDQDRAKLAELEDKKAQLGKKLIDSQTEMDKIASGEATPEERQAQFEDIQATLDSLAAEIEEFNSSLELTNLDESGFITEVDSYEIESLKQNVEGEIDSAAEQIKTSEEAEVEKAKIQAEKDARNNFADAISDAQGYLNGTKGWYFSGKIWKGDKYIKNYYDNNQTYARTLMSELETAVRRGGKDGWGGFMSAIDGIPADAVDDVVGTVYAVLKKELGASRVADGLQSSDGSGTDDLSGLSVLDIMPSYVLDHMAGAIKKGNNPGDKTIYTLPADGYDPKSNRRRNDMQFSGITALDAANDLKRLADKNKESNPFRESDGDVDAEDDTLAYGE